MLISRAVSFDRHVRLMGFTEDGVRRVDVGTFDLGAVVHRLFFIGTQLVALSPTGKIGVWNSMTQHWQSQELAPITSYDTAGTFLLLGSSNGSIHYIDMQKFPLRMKDNDLLVRIVYISAVCLLFGRVADNKLPCRLIDSKIIVELKILVVILCHDNSAVVN